MNKTKAGFASWGSAVLWFILILMSLAFVGVMIFDYVARLIICWLGIYSSNGNLPRHETLKFIGFMMSGVLAAIGVIAINRRADAQTESAEAQAKSSEAQAKSAEAQMENNKLAKKSRIDDRFNFAAQNVGSEHARTRIAAYNQFYYLAKSSHLGKNDRDFKENIFKILCSCFRPMPHHLLRLDNPEEECKKQCKEQRPERQKQCVEQCVEKLKSAREEYKMLFDFLFESVQSDDKDFKSPFHQFSFDFRETNLTKATFSGVKLLKANFKRAILSEADLSETDLSEADLSEADLRDAQLKGVKLQNIRCIEKTDFRGAKIDKAPVLRKHLPNNKGNPIAYETDEEFSKHDLHLLRKDDHKKDEND